MIRTPRYIVTKALKRINAYGQGDQMPAEDLMDGFDALTDMLDNWKTDRLAVLVVANPVVALTSGKSAYTIGKGGDWDIDRPIWNMARASILTNYSPPNPLELPMNIMTEDEWQRIPVKTVMSGLPTALYCDRNYDANGLATVHVYPVPNVPALTIKLSIPTTLDDFTSIDTPYDFAPGYLPALIWNLAVEMAPDFDIEPSPRVLAKAMQTLGDIRRVNITPETVILDRFLWDKDTATFNPNTGEPT